MPKRFYNVQKVRSELQRNRARVECGGPVGEHKLMVLLGGNLRRRRPNTDAPVFEELDRAFGSKPIGARTVFSTQRKGGQKVDFVYEKRPSAFVLVERHYYPASGGAPRIEKVAWKKALK